MKNKGPTPATALWAPARAHSPLSQGWASIVNIWLAKGANVGPLGGVGTLRCEHGSATTFPNLIFEKKSLIIFLHETLKHEEMHAKRHNFDTDSRFVILRSYEPNDAIPVQVMHLHLTLNHVSIATTI